MDAFDEWEIKREPGTPGPQESSPGIDLTQESTNQKSTNQKSTNQKSANQKSTNQKSSNQETNQPIRDPTGVNIYPSGSGLQSRSKPFEPVDAVMESSDEEESDKEEPSGWGQWLRKKFFK